MKNVSSRLTRVLCAVAGVLLIISLFVPLWQIDLDAPQYPEGLNLKIYPNKLGGDVQTINGLNHYIGMQTLHAEAFVEFKVLPYIIGSFALLILVIGWLGSRRLLYVVFGAFVVFGILAMVDFWRWEYDYGHNLDPTAAIVIPGMAYQPPLIGFKQLLNFGAYSIPDIGGWCFIIAGLAMLTGVIVEAKKARLNKRTTAVATLLAVVLVSCSGVQQPTPIEFGNTKCNFCRMTIADKRFAAQMQSKKGRFYSFDDIKCMQAFQSANKDIAIANTWVSDYQLKTLTLKVEDAMYVRSEQLKSPMQGNIAAFGSAAEADRISKQFATTMLPWTKLNP